jgi:hypothetical protein
MEDSNRDDFQMPPLFYLKKWISPYGVTKQSSAKQAWELYKSKPENERPNYIVFLQAENISTRSAVMKYYFPGMTYETTIEPSAVDKLMHFLNPMNNENHTTYIYKIGSPR